MTLKADFIPVTDVKPGMRLAAVGIVTDIRISKSGKSIKFCGRRPGTDNDPVWWPWESTLANCAVFTDLAPADVREQDARNFPHDEPCPYCGRRQWGLRTSTVDPMNPTDAEQETCGACGYSCSEPQIGRVTRTGTYLTETGVESGTVTHDRQ